MMAATLLQAVWVARGADRFGEHHGVGIGVAAFKVVTADSDGTLVVVELTHYAKGGPARHVHPEQDEWFYVVEGEYVVEVGAERFRLHAGDSLFAPRNVPHVWAYVGEHRGRLLGILAPAGQIEAFFREFTKADAPAPQDAAFFRAYGMELVGPPLALE